MKQREKKRDAGKLTKERVVQGKETNTLRERDLMDERQRRLKQTD